MNERNYCDGGSSKHTEEVSNEELLLNGDFRSKRVRRIG